MSDPRFTCADDVIGEHALEPVGAGDDAYCQSLSRGLFSRRNPANAPWFAGKSRATALSQLARQAGLSFHALNTAAQAFGQWHLPVVAELRDGQLMVIEHFNGEDTLDVFIIAEEGQRNRLTIAELLPEIVSITAPRLLSALKDSRVDRYISRFKPDWMRELVLKDIRPYLPVSDCCLSD